MVVAPKQLEKLIDKDLVFVNVDDFVGAGSIYEASALIEEFSHLKLCDGSRLTKFLVFKGYELWWLYYNNLFLYFCLPYTQYKKLLEHLKTYSGVYLYQPPYKSLFSSYLLTHKCKFKIFREPRLKALALVPFGIIIQIFITVLCLLILVVNKRHLLVFIGDKFEKNKDYDFRMKFIYQELRERNIPFVEFIRSLESWRKVLQHVFIRKRPVIYSEGLAFVGRFFSFLSSERFHIKRELNSQIFDLGVDSDKRFKLLMATHYLFNASDDVWAIRIMAWVLRVIGVRGAYITAALDRNFHTVLGCKLNDISTVGILHGVASQYYNGYDFLPAFDGTKMLSVDRYGLWSEWWREYYLKNSKAYRSQQLYISGPMRPLEKNLESKAVKLVTNPEFVKVLLVPGELSDPHEIMIYWLELMKVKDLSLYITFRPYRDGFERWLNQNHPEMFEKIGEGKILRGNIHEAINQCDIVVGSYSTGALEALLFLKPVVFFQTDKWGDYFNLKKYDEKHSFFAENPKDLIDKIRNAKFTSVDVLADLRGRYFGDPFKNGSKWVVDQLDEMLSKGCLTK